MKNKIKQLTLLNRVIMIILAFLLGCLIVSIFSSAMPSNFTISILIVFIAFLIMYCKNSITIGLINDVIKGKVIIYPLSKKQSLKFTNTFIPDKILLDDESFILCKILKNEYNEPYLQRSSDDVEYAIIDRYFRICRKLFLIDKLLFWKCTSKNDLNINLNN